MQKINWIVITRKSQVNLNITNKQEQDVQKAVSCADAGMSKVWKTISAIFAIGSKTAGNEDQVGLWLQH